jgi:aryl-alcohol dehydrogenase-like predicted oxidoreductase
MEYAALGNTGLVVSRLAFGCWAIGGHGYGRTDDVGSIASIHSALDLGINFFDTADVYGFGHSEKILSEALGNQRHEVVIATKFGVCWDDSGKIFRDCSPKRAEMALDESLRRLGIDSIPLYQIHWPDGITPISETVEALLRFQKAGKIQYFGCSNFPSALINEVNKIAPSASIQAHFSIVNRENESLLKECFGATMGTMAFGVLGRGIFSGRYDRDSRFGEKDTRAMDPDFQGERMEQNIRLANRLEEIGKNYGRSASQVAIRWVLDTPYITSAVVGMKSDAQALENSGAAGWNLDPLHYAGLSDLLRV